MTLGAAHRDAQCAVVNRESGRLWKTDSPAGAMPTSLFTLSFVGERALSAGAVRAALEKHQAHAVQGALHRVSTVAADGMCACETSHDDRQTAGGVAIFQSGNKKSQATERRRIYG